MKKIITLIIIYFTTLICPSLSLAASRVNTQSIKAQKVDNRCTITGCSAEICTNQFSKEDDGLATTCEYKDYYECYKLADCSFTKSTKLCGWEINPQFTACLKAKKAPQALFEKITGRHVIHFVINLK